MPINHWFKLAIMKLNLSVCDFWSMPYFMFIDLLHDYAGSTNTQGVSRKELIDMERDAFNRLGWV